MVHGVDVKPLSKGSLKGKTYEDGGGYKVSGKQDGQYLQYHPDSGSHHNGEYYKLSSGKTGTQRYDMMVIVWQWTKRLYSVGWILMNVNLNIQQGKEYVIKEQTVDITGLTILESYMLLSMQKTKQKPRSTVLKMLKHTMTLYHKMNLLS